MVTHYLLGVLLLRLLEKGDKGTSFARLLLGIPGSSTGLLLRIISFRLLLTDTALIQRALDKWAQGLQRLMTNFGSLKLVLTTATSYWRLLLPLLSVPRDKVLNLLLLTTCKRIRQLDAPFLQTCLLMKKLSWNVRNWDYALISKLQNGSVISLQQSNFKNCEKDKKAVFD